MKVYLAHNYSAKEWLKSDVVPKLESMGIRVTSRWIKEDPSSDPYGSESQTEEAPKDVQDVYAADYLVLFTDNYGNRPGRGKYVELGMAIAYDKQIVLCGKDMGCVFYYLPHTHKVSNIEALYEYFRTRL